MIEIGPGILPSPKYPPPYIPPVLGGLNGGGGGSGVPCVGGVLPMDIHEPLSAPLLPNADLPSFHLYWLPSLLLNSPGLTPATPNGGYTSLTGIGSDFTTETTGSVVSPISTPMFDSEPSAFGSNSSPSIDG